MLVFLLDIPDANVWGFSNANFHFQLDDPPGNEHSWLENSPFWMIFTRKHEDFMGYIC